MASNPHEQPDDHPATGPTYERLMYERTFARTVLQLLGITSPGNLAEWTIGRKYLYLYDLKVAVERARRQASVPEPRSSGAVRNDAVEHAFMLIRFGSVLPPDKAQSKALVEWQIQSTLHHQAHR